MFASTSRADQPNRSNFQTITTSSLPRRAASMSLWSPGRSFRAPLPVSSMLRTASPPSRVAATVAHRARGQGYGPTWRRGGTWRCEYESSRASGPSQAHEHGAKPLNRKGSETAVDGSPFHRVAEME